MQPFVKWAGGKRQLIKEIKSLLPSNFNTYYEPFIGGGALLFHLQPKKAVINDLSTDLINVYNQISLNYDLVAKEIDLLMKQHILSPKSHYYKIRNEERTELWRETNNTYKAARFMYLNKTCFNGLYRVNSLGYFNVPFNGKKDVKVYDSKNLEEISKYIKSSVKIYNTDFEKVCKMAKKGDFVFLDPPYDLIKDDTFSDYNSIQFKKEEQIRLSEIFHKLDKKGVFLMLTNHNTELINKLYSKYRIKVIKVKRMINANAKKRNGEEVIITNY